jgi:toxin-antitoxin system PIN domain toxin
MIIPDVNLLLHAYNADSKVHSAAKDWWEQTVSGPRPVGLPWVSLLGFIRLITRRGVFPNPMPPGEAARRVRQWLAFPIVQIIHPGERHAEILFGLLEHLGTAGDLTTDAHLAALAIEYQAELASTDVDFARFPRLRWFNPLRGR